MGSMQHLVCFPVDESKAMYDNDNEDIYEDE